MPLKKGSLSIGGPRGYRPRRDAGKMWDQVLLEFAKPEVTKCSFKEAGTTFTSKVQGLYETKRPIVLAAEKIAACGSNGRKGRQKAKRGRGGKLRNRGKPTKLKTLGQKSVAVAKKSHGGKRLFLF